MAFLEQVETGEALLQSFSDEEQISALCWLTFDTMGALLTQWEEVTYRPAHWTWSSFRPI